MVAERGVDAFAGWFFSAPKVGDQQVTCGGTSWNLLAGIERVPNGLRAGVRRMRASFRCPFWGAGSMNEVAIFLCGLMWSCPLRGHAESLPRDVSISKGRVLGCHVWMSCSYSVPAAHSLIASFLLDFPVLS